MLYKILVTPCNNCIEFSTFGGCCTPTSEVCRSSTVPVENMSFCSWALMKTDIFCCFPIISVSQWLAISLYGTSGVVDTENLPPCHVVSRSWRGQHSHKNECNQANMFIGQKYVYSICEHLFITFVSKTIMKLQIAKHVEVLTCWTSTVMTALC